MKIYHAHIYFPESRSGEAQGLLEELSKSPVFYARAIALKPVGPHPLPMIELHFKESNLGVARDVIEKNRSGLSVLIHIDEGIDDVKDHTENIEWLGQKLDLDFEFFEIIKTRPDLKVHKD